MSIILLVLSTGKWNKFPDKYKTINQDRGKEFNGNDEVVVIFHQFKNFFLSDLFLFFGFQFEIAAVIVLFCFFFFVLFFNYLSSSLNQQVTVKCTIDETAGWLE